MRRVVRQVHLWMGLSLGALFVLLGLSGSILVFYPEIDAVLNPVVQSSVTVRPDWDKSLRTVRAAFPNKHGPWRFEVTGKAGAIPARYYNPPETSGRDFAPLMVWLSPDGARVLRHDYWGNYAMTFIYDLHYRLLGGKAVGKGVGYAGIGIVLLLLTGLWAWWPRGTWSKALRFKQRGSPIRLYRDVHKLTGLGGAVFLFILTITGVMLELPDESDAALASVAGPVDPPVHAASRQAADGPISVNRVVKAAKDALPAARLAWIEVPGEDGGPFRIRMEQPGDPSVRFPHSFVWIDQSTGAVLAVQDSQKAGRATTINNWVHPLHDGSVAGLSSRIVAFLAGLIPLLLFVTGWKRYRMRKIRPKYPIIPM